MKTNPAAHAATLIQQKIPGLIPKIGIILGSGLGKFADNITNSIVIPYEELPGFAACKVEGHPSNLCLGKIYNYPVVCLQGRAHLYEGISNDVILTMIRTLKLLGCEILLITNSAGSLRADVTPGNLMLITDHINFQFSNPLVGCNDSHYGARFVAMEDAYDPELQKKFLNIAKDLKIDLPQGVYIGVLGPSFETPAEIRAFRILGADAVGMSTVPEVIAARHCGLRVACISGITNMAAGMNDVPLSHHQTLAGAQLTIQNLTNLLLTFIKNLSNESNSKQSR